jgi:hypothetical protein
MISSGWLNFLWKLIEKGIKFQKRPKLILYFDRSETYRVRNVVDQDNVPGFFCHLMVKNNGKEIVRNCYGKVIEVAVRDENGNFTRHPLFSNPFVLKWAHEDDFNPRDVENDLPRRLDFCYSIQSIPDKLIFFTPQKPDGNLTIYPPGTYSVRVRIYAENTKAVDGYFNINFSGQWNQISISEAQQT